ncbi:lipopolysaccharide transport periplasmic protein LptA [Undibacterium sp. TJN25]|uniref:lipopolysaccharide transport periplasmic protein LptA n=1 Tax=Undibacterium sp. TJN25 TaxID=3413056 RepID=UPI003BF36601
MKNNTHFSSARLPKSLFLAACILLPAAVLAEQADRYKKIDLEAESSVLDDKTKIKTMTGNVEITRGTLLIKTDKAVATEGAEGFQFIVMTRGPGGQAFFRQKRDGGPNLWVEGVADRMEYDEKTEVVKFFNKAHVKYLEGKKVTQEQEGEFMSYDSKTENFVGANNASGTSVSGGGRIKITIQPKLEEPKPDSPTTQNTQKK